MKFFKLGDYAMSWSTQVLAVLTAGATLEHFTGLVTQVLPQQYHGIAVAVISGIGLVLRAIKQGGK